MSRRRCSPSCPRLASSQITWSPGRLGEHPATLWLQLYLLARLRHRRSQSTLLNRLITIEVSRAGASPPRGWGTASHPSHVPAPARGDKVTAGVSSRLPQAAAGARAAEGARRVHAGFRAPHAPETLAAPALRPPQRDRPTHPGGSGAEAPGLPPQPGTRGVRKRRSPPPLIAFGEAGRRAACRDL